MTVKDRVKWLWAYARKPLIALRYRWSLHKTSAAGDVAEELAPFLCSLLQERPFMYDIVFTMIASAMSDHYGIGPGFVIKGKKLHLRNLAAVQKALDKASKKYGRIY